MVGSYNVRVSRRRGVSFRFTIRRNITVVRGDSGTGKTTLFEMVSDHMREGAKSGVTIQCDHPCVALVDMDWENQLAGMKNSIVFVDEGLQAIRSDEFARAVKHSGNYFVLFTREVLANLPYSVDEIYHIKTSGRYHTLVPLYKHDDTHRYYEQLRAKPKRDFDLLVTEDSKAGFQFFDARFKESDVSVLSAGTNSKVLEWLDRHKGDHVFVIADGAAFGPYADRVLALQHIHRDTMAVCLPESFEWLLLESGLIKSDVVREVLADPSAHVDSEEHESWEQYFTDVLRTQSAGTPFAYRKGELADAYKVAKNADKVMALIACRNIR